MAAGDSVLLVGDRSSTVLGRLFEAPLIVSSTGAGGGPEEPPACGGGADRQTVGR